jgi:hypothetical protein
VKTLLDHILLSISCTLLAQTNLEGRNAHTSRELVQIQTHEALVTDAMEDVVVARTGALQFATPLM